MVVKRSQDSGFYSALEKVFAKIYALLTPPHRFFHLIIWMGNWYFVAQQKWGLIMQILQKRHLRRQERSPFQNEVRKSLFSYLHKLKLSDCPQRKNLLTDTFATNQILCLTLIRTSRACSFPWRKNKNVFFWKLLVLCYFISPWYHHHHRILFSPSARQQAVETVLLFAIIRNGFVSFSPFFFSSNFNDSIWLRG